MSWKSPTSLGRRAQFGIIPICVLFMQFFVHIVADDLNVPMSNLPADRRTGKGKETFSNRDISFEQINSQCLNHLIGLILCN